MSHDQKSDKLLIYLSNLDPRHSNIKHDLNFLQMYTKPPI